MDSFFLPKANRDLWQSRIVRGAIPVGWNCFIRIYDPARDRLNIFGRKIWNK